MTLLAWSAIVVLVIVAISGTIEVDEHSHVTMAPTCGSISYVPETPPPSRLVDGPAHDARFNSPTGIAVDDAGNLFVVDRDNRVIRKISTNGTVSTLAGTPGLEGCADGAGSKASFYVPEWLDLDDGGWIYVADRGMKSIRKISPSGLVSTLPHLDDNSHTQESRSTAYGVKDIDPLGLAIDSNRNIYVLASNLVFKIKPDGEERLLAGQVKLDDKTFDRIDHGDIDGTGPSAIFDIAQGIAADNKGFVYVTEGTDVRMISDQGRVTTIAGKKGKEGYVDGNGLDARFDGIGPIVAASTGDLYVLDQGNQAIRKISPGGIVSTYAKLTNCSNYKNFTANLAGQIPFEGMAMDRSGNIFLTERIDGRILKVNTKGVVSVEAGAP